MSIKKVIKNIFIGIWNVIKAISKLIQDYMKSTWDKWDEEAGIKKPQPEPKTRREPNKGVKKATRQPRKQHHYEINPDDFDEIHLKRRKKDDK